jgi:hypothetical protein
VTLGDDGTFLAPSASWKVQTSRSNITGAHITRYRWWTALGVRGSMVDDGLNFRATTTPASASIREKVLPRGAGHSH